MTYTFADLRNDAFKNLMASPDYHGETIRYVAEDLENGELNIDVHCSHSQEQLYDDRNNQEIVESLTVRISRDYLARAPKDGDVVYRNGDPIPFLYACSGGDQPHYWRRVFQRRSKVSQGLSVM